jgi:hypothetical protein
VEEADLKVTANLRDLLAGKITKLEIKKAEDYLL